MKNLKKGFTLIELMIVVAIIAILAVVAAPKFGQQLKKSKDSQAVSILGTFRSAITMHAADNEAVYATSFSALVDYVDDKTQTSSYQPMTASGATPNVYTTGTGFTATTSLSTPVGTSSYKATDNRFYATMQINGDTEESTVNFTSGSGDDTKGTSWAGY